MATVKRPTGVTAIAIINIILGALGLCGVLGSIMVVVLALSADPNKPPAPAPAAGTPANPFDTLQDQQAFMIKEAPGYKPFMIGACVFTIISTTLLLASGIGMLKLRPWARKAGILWAGLAILVALGTIGYTVSVTLPATEKWEDQQRVKLQQAGGVAPPSTAGLSGVVGVGSEVLFRIIYPVIALVVLMGKSARDAFAGIGPRRRSVEDEDEGWGSSGQEDRDDRGDDRPDDGEGRYRDRRDY